MRPDEFLPPEPRPRPLGDVRFYVDEDVLGLGYALAWARQDTIVCGLPPLADDLGRGTVDQDWIPIVAARGWIAITGNARIRTNPAEAHVATDAGLRAICIVDSRGRADTWQKLAQLARWWSSLETFVAVNPRGPWWVNVLPSGLAERAYRPSG